jgi:Flp pilus assembly protein TadB
MTSDLQEQLRAARKGRRDSLVAPKTDFAPEPKAPRWLISVAILAGLALILIALSYVATIPPAHLIIIGVPVALVLLCQSP